MPLEIDLWNDILRKAITRVVANTMADVFNSIQGIPMTADQRNQYF